MTNEFSPSSDAANAPPSPPDWETIARFLTGESSAEEAKTLTQWLADHPEDRALIEQLDAVISKQPLVPDVDVEAALARVHQRMGDDARDDVIQFDTHRVGARRAPRRSRYFVGAAALATAAALTFVLLRSNEQQTSSAAAARTIATATGQRDSVLLADGSRVILGPGSRLVVPADYGMRDRAVELRGAGYFDVRHDPAKPFSVHAPNAVIEDIGTTFTVRSDTNSATTVAVLSGSVRLRSNSSAPTSGAVLAAGDRGTLTTAGDVNTYPHSVVPEDSVWTTGALVFHDTPLSEVAGELRRWYGVELQVADSALLDRHLNASFDGDSLDAVLKVIGLTLDARIERQGNQATMRMNHGSASMR